MENQEGLKQFFVEMDEDVRALLLRKAAQADQSMNELVVVALANEFGIDYEGRGQPFQPERATGTSNKRTFWIPVSIKQVFHHAAVDMGVSQRTMFNTVMRNQYGRKKRKRKAAA